MKITVAFGCSVAPPNARVGATRGCTADCDEYGKAAQVVAQGLIGVRQFSGRQVDRVFELVSAELTTRF